MPHSRAAALIALTVSTAACALHDERAAVPEPPPVPAAPTDSAPPPTPLLPRAPLPSVIDSPPLPRARFVPAGQIGIACSRHTASLLADGRVLVVGDCSYFCFSPSALLYDPATDSWTLAPELLHPRGGHTATVLGDGSVLLVGGESRDGTSVVPIMERWHPGDPSWQCAGALSLPRWGHLAAPLSDSRLLVAGGSTAPSGAVSDSCTPSVEILDTTSRTTIPADPLPEARCDALAIARSSGTLVVGGRGDGSDRARADALYDAATDRWRALGDPGVLLGHVLVPLGDDRWLRIDGSGAALLGAGDDRWQSLAGPIHPRTGAAAARLPDGRVLVVGGTPYEQNDRAEIFDPTTRTFHETARHGGSYLHATATPLLDGRVLVVGDTAELYVPATID